MIQLKNVSKTYTLKGGVEVHALQDLSLSLPPQGLVFVLGKSGSGKSTLLNLLGALDRPDSGEIVVDGVSMKEFSGDELDAYRNTYLGFIFQEYNILNDYTVGENIALALHLQKKKDEAGAVETILKRVGLEGLSSRRPKELSGGQKQRVAIARALVKDPRLLLADEPTGALDSKTGEAIFDLLKELSKDRLVLVVSHDRDFAERFADRIIEIKDGKVLSDVVKSPVVEKKLSEHIALLKNGLLEISSGKALTDEELSLLDTTLAKGNNESILSANPESIATFKATNGLGESEKSFSFEPLVSQPEADQEATFKPVHSKLPFKDSFKMGASGLRLKPLRLIVTILLAAFSLSIFALTDATFAYSPVEAATLGLANSSINYLGFYKQTTPSGSYYQTISMEDEDLAKLNKDTGMNFLKSESLSFYFSSNLLSGENSYYSSRIYSFASFHSLGVYSETEAKSLGFTIYGTYPSKANEIALSSYAFHFFKKYGYTSKEPNSSEDRLVVPANQITNAEAFLKKGITIDSQRFNSETSSYETTRFAVTAIIDEGFDENHYALLEKLNPSDEEKTRMNGLSSELSDALQNGFSGLVYTNALTQAAYEGASGDTPLRFALARKPSSKDKIRELVRYSYKTYSKESEYTAGRSGYVIENYVFQIYLAANTLADSGKTAFFWIAFVSAIFASLGLLNFILISISAKKREIGILRGLGARGSDIFWIFFNETLLIVAIEWLLSLLAGWGWCTLFNRSIEQGMGFTVYAFNFGVRQVFVVLGIALLTAFLSTFLPCYLLSRKKPIDSINNR